MKQLIERECGITLSVRGVETYLNRWGFTPQKPIKKAYEQRPEAVQTWLDETYPVIEARAKAEGAEIHWGDETALVNTDVRGRCYAPAGKTPAAFTVGGTRQKLSMIATVSNKGKTRWMIIDEAFNAEKLNAQVPHEGHGKAGNGRQCLCKRFIRLKRSSANSPRRLLAPTLPLPATPSLRSKTEKLSASESAGVVRAAWCRCTGVRVLEP